MDHPLSLIEPQDLDLGGKTYLGEIFHVAGPMDDGWRVVDGWESQEAFEPFFQEKLGQALQKNDISAPQVQQFWPVHNNPDTTGACTPSGVSTQAPLPYGARSSIDAPANRKSAAEGDLLHICMSR